MMRVRACIALLLVVTWSAMMILTGRYLAWLGRVLPWLHPQTAIELERTLRGEA